MEQIIIFLALCDAQDLRLKSQTHVIKIPILFPILNSMESVDQISLIAVTIGSLFIFDTWTFSHFNL